MQRCFRHVLLFAAASAFACSAALAQGPMVIKLSHVVDHMDHICQLAGNARHVAIGTDLDGGFGREQSPADLDTIADLQKFPDLLRKRGYSEADVTGITYGNWVRFLEKALPR